jgi:hypothetical protein
VASSRGRVASAGPTGRPAQRTCTACASCCSRSLRSFSSSSTTSSGAQNCSASLSCAQRGGGRSAGRGLGRQAVWGGVPAGGRRGPCEGRGLQAPAGRGLIEGAAGACCAGSGAHREVGVVHHRGIALLAVCDRHGVHALQRRLLLGAGAGAGLVRHGGLSLGVRLRCARGRARALRVVARRSGSRWRAMGRAGAAARSATRAATQRLPGASWHGVAHAGDDGGSGRGGELFECAARERCWGALRSPGAVLRWRAATYVSMVRGRGRLCRARFCRGRGMEEREVRTRGGWEVTQAGAL